MCTVVVEVPASAEGSTRVLAVRDEDPARPWDPLGRWWPDTHPGTIGVRDRRAGGAWLAAAGGAGKGRLSVLLNRAIACGGNAQASAAAPLASRGTLVLASAAGEPLADDPVTAGFNLVEVQGSRVFVSSWDGCALRTQQLPAGVHMIAHDGVDDPKTARIAHWLPEFTRLAGLPNGGWQRPWRELFERTTALDPADDRAIIRDNRPHGVPTLSLTACLAEVSRVGVELDSVVLSRPGEWNPKDPPSRAVL